MVRQAHQPCPIAILYTPLEGFVIPTCNRTIHFIFIVNMNNTGY